jgi:hypothetical protein
LDTNQSTPGYAGFGRLLWIAFGPAMLAVTTLHIFMNGTGWLTLPDFVFWTIVASMILGRWLEVLGGVPLTSVGEPAMQKDFYKYVVWVLVLSAAVWVVANAFGNRGGT